MTKQEFLAMSLPYQLKVKVLCGDGVFDTIDTLTIGNLYELGANRIKPIVRPLSDLTKPIVQADYNEGKPFVPIVELAKIAFPKATESINIYPNGICVIDTGGAYVFRYSVPDKSFMCVYLPENRECFIPNQLQLFQMLLKWHFNLMDEGVEVVNVTDEFNPYK